VELHPLAAQFGSVVEAYDRGRPDYAPAVVGAMAAELGFRPGASVLDLAAGTGKLTRALVAAGLDVTAIEPQPELRERLAQAVGSRRVRDGVAEAIPLDDGSVDAVTVADAFHWFDHQRAIAEIHRVLKPHGGLAVLFTVPDWTGASWAHELGKMIEGLRPEHPGYDGPRWQDSLRDAGGWTEPREIRVTTSGPADPARIVDYVASMSFVAAMPEDERAEWLARASELVESGETPAELSVHVAIGLASPL
jgi:SAM-dependent methyltransferase